MYSIPSLLTTLILFIIINLPKCQEEEAQDPQADHHSAPANPPPNHNEPPNKPTPQLPLNSLEVCSLASDPLWWLAWPSELALKLLTKPSEEWWEEVGTTKPKKPLNNSNNNSRVINNKAANSRLITSQTVWRKTKRSLTARDTQTSWRCARTISLND